MKHSIIMILTLILIISSGCSSHSKPEDDVSNKSNEELIRLLEDQSDPNNLFDAVTKELARRGPSAFEAAPALSIALTYPRRDSYLAGFALMAIGPDAKIAIPILVSELSHERSAVRRYSALTLGTIGQDAQCAIPLLASLLWHTDSETRAAAAISIDAITGIDLVDPENKIDPKTPGIMPLDEPEGIVSSSAREWWSTAGEDMTWPTKNCESPK